jgi:endonuclease/exonuclease/phosphatase family metal-dependent hydrolase
MKKNHAGLRKGIWRAGALCFLALGISACEAVSPDAGGTRTDQGGRFSLVTWNLEALFDGEEAGTEYEEYRKAAGWNGEKYRARLTAIARGVAAMGDRVPDLLAFQETENLGTLEDLSRGELAGRGYRWTFFAANPGASLGLGVLSRFPFTLARIHSLNLKGEVPPRPVLELWVEVRNRPLVLLVCHWKSKLGGEDATESLRRASARIILRRLREIDREHPGAPVIVLGDLNENHDEFYRRGGASLRALLPDDARAASLAAQDAGEDTAQGKSPGDFLVLSRKKPPEAACFTPGIPALYTPWGGELSGGSYYYRGSWETIDHFLLNGALFDGTGWEFDACRVLTQEPFTNSKGYPNAYRPQSGGGLSDHLPLILDLKLIPGNEAAPD